jgi:ELWxxDGT repeat protein
MNKSFLFVIMMVAASFTGCIDGSDDSDDLVEPVGEVNVPGNALVLTKTASQDDCPSGGITLDVGVDEDGDGKLNSTEKFNTSTICNGADGENGKDGNNGVDGSSCSAFDSGNGTYTVSCTDGTNFTVSDGQQGPVGEKGDSGQDVTRSNTTVLTRIDDPADSLNCEAGGRVISHGLDNGDGNGIESNGLLEESEIDSSTTLCTTLSIGMMLDINLGADSSNPSKFTALNDDQIIFTANDGSKGTELWMVTLSSGTAALVKDIDTRIDGYGNGYSSSPYEFTLFNDELYFRANDADHGSELWKTDGTRDGTVMLKDIDERNGYGSGPSGFTLFNDELYFRASDADNGTELWKTDGTEDGTVLVKDIDTRTDSYGNPYSSSPYEFTLFNDELYFRANDADHGTELWKTDGTEDGTVLVKDIDPREYSSGSKYSGNPYGLTVMGDSLYFSAYDSSGNELWKSDGTRIGTTRIADIREGESGSNPAQFTVLGDYMYFRADDGESGTELWKTSGTGASLLKDIFPGESNGYPNSSYPINLYVFNNHILFSAQDVNGTELWKTDGTEDGTYMVKDIHPGNSTSGYPLSSSPSSFVTVGDTMYFTATGQFGKELYSSDGSTTGTQLVEDFNYGSADGLSCSSYDCYYNDYGGSLFALDGYLLFSAQDGYFGYELYFNQLRETNVYYN